MYQKQLSSDKSNNSHPQNHQPPHIRTPPKLYRQLQKQQSIFQILRQRRIPRLLRQLLCTPSQQLLPSGVRPDELARGDAAGFVNEETYLHPLDR